MSDISMRGKMILRKTSCGNYMLLGLFPDDPIYPEDLCVKGDEMLVADVTIHSGGLRFTDSDSWRASPEDLLGGENGRLHPKSWKTKTTI